MLKKIPKSRPTVTVVTAWIVRLDAASAGTLSTEKYYGPCYTQKDAQKKADELGYGYDVFVGNSETYFAD